jgi:hypothetical protein
MAEMSYKKAGVDIDRAEAFVKRIIPLIERTLRPEVLEKLGDQHSFHASSQGDQRSCFCFLDRWQEYGFDPDTQDERPTLRMLEKIGLSAWVIWELIEGTRGVVIQNRERCFWIPHVRY